MKIYESEKSLASLIESTKSVALCVAVKPSDEKSDLLVSSLNKIREEGCGQELGKAIAQIADDPHPDLMYGEAILVSTGINRNDDVFLPDETWKARFTPVNTPYNDNHVDIDIIGHIIAARVLDSDGKEVVGDEAPDYFDIAVDFVVYKSIFPAVAKEIAEKGPKGEKFVSMEAFFNDFDYALIDGETKAGKVIARNADTAFLTKYLRAYGGDGVYKNFRVGRVLRDFRFSGMGNVDQPANPGSEYRKIENYKLVAHSSLDEIDKKVVLHVTKGNIMKIENLDQANSVIADLTKKLEEAQASLESKVKAEEQAQVTELNDKLNAANTKVTVAEQELTKANEKVAALETELNTVKAELKNKTDELDKIAKAAKTAERVSALKELGVSVTEEKAAEIAELSDKAFATVLEFTKSVASTKNSEKKEDEKVTDPAAVANAENDANKQLENAKADEKTDVTNTAGDNQTDVEKIQKAAAKLVEVVRRPRVKSNAGPKKE